MRDWPPIRVCCGTRHFGVLCPQRLVMCCHCFESFSMSYLAEEDGVKTDVCIPCWNKEDAEMKRRGLR